MISISSVGRNCAMTVKMCRTKGFFGVAIMDGGASHVEASHVEASHVSCVEQWRLHPIITFLLPNLIPARLRATNPAFVFGIKVMNTS